MGWGGEEGSGGLHDNFETEEGGAQIFGAPLLSMLLCHVIYTVDLVIFAKFLLLRISRKGRIRLFKNLARIIILIALLKKNEKFRKLLREN